MLECNVIRMIHIQQRLVFSSLGKSGIFFQTLNPLENIYIHAVQYAVNVSIIKLCFSPLSLFSNILVYLTC